jgi:penicillin-binding protein 2
MPLDPANDRRPPITPQLAIRVAGAGVVAFVLFGIIFFRLWYLEVLDGDKYLAQARENRVRTEVIQAPRGDILDADSNPLVTSRKANVVTLNPAGLPVEFRDEIAAYGQQAGRWALRKQQRVKQLGKKAGTKKAGSAPARPMADGALLERYQRLGKVLRMSPKTINDRVVDAVVRVPYSSVRIRTDVPSSQRNYIEERQTRFPGIDVASIFVRQYPRGMLAAQVLGTIGQISAEQVEAHSYKGVTAGSDVGQTGLEATYDRVLRGTDGKYRIEVNAAGERRRATVADEPEQGRQLRLTLRLDLQEAGEKALKTAGKGLPGAFVAMNPDNGAIYAMGSSPSYKPRDAAPGRYSTNAAYKAKFVDAATNYPLINRADESAYPTGSIFKPITSLAALDAGLVTPTTRFVDQGCLKVGARKDIDVKCNAGKTAYGNIDMADALRVSSDVYYYELGLKLWNTSGNYLQKWASKLGVARKTGLDLPGESGGSIPSAAQVRRLQDAERACRKKNDGKPCGYAFLDSRWNPGDEANFAVGQGGLQATPLQMAVAYSAIINSGRVVRPHLGAEVEDSRGIIEKIDKPSRGKVTINPGWRDTIMRGLYGAANEDKGTSQGVWAQDWPKGRFPIYGKTGTAERDGQNDQSWYVAYSYDKRNNSKPILIICTVEQGGFGAEAAAPAVRLIMSQWFGVDAKLIRGTSQDR